MVESAYARAARLRAGNTQKTLPQATFAENYTCVQGSSGRFAGALTAPAGAANPSAALAEATWTEPFCGLLARALAESLR